MSEMYEPQTYETPQPPTPSLREPNPLLGTVGAMLFSLAGVALYVIVYQMGIIAGIIGFAIFWLAQFGFGLFGGCKGNVPMSGFVVCIVVTVVMLIVAEFVALTISTQNYLADEGYYLTLSQTAEAVLETIQNDSAALGDVVSDLAFSFLFAGAAIASHIAQNKKKAG